MRARVRAYGLGGITVCAALLSEPASALGDDTEAVCQAAYERAQELRLDGNLERAREELTVCERTCPATLAKDCQAWLGELPKTSPTVVVLVPAPPPTGAPTPRPVASAPAPENRSSGPPMGALILGGVGVASLAVSGVLATLGHVERSDLADSSCGATSSCDPDLADPIRAKWIASGILAGVGGALVGTGVVLWLLDSPGERKIGVGVATGRAGRLETTFTARF